MTATSRSGRALLGLILVLALLAPAFAFAAAAAPIPSPILDPGLASARGRVHVIVQKQTAADRSAEAAVRQIGGRITAALPIVDGFAATVPSGSVRLLAALPGARAVSLDRRVEVLGGGAASTPNSVYPQSVRADDVWRAGTTGRGISVALIDTGVTAVADVAGRVLPVYDDIRGTWSPCLNLSGEASCDDSYGHGTFLAGIIAGNGASSGGAWKGIAPEANIVSVKIAGRDGSADVSKVLAAIQWVVSFRDRYNIRVLNLSLGTNSTQSYRVDPLNYAVERAWTSGIVVVVSASNRGPGPQTISKPGDDPWVITVGAVDDRGTPGVGDDSLPDFSSRGPTAADGLSKPDLVAPGAHIVSLRAPGSAIDTQFPNYVDGAYRKGSGTSMSAAVVSGAVALMLEANPAATPDRVKYALTATARRAASTNPLEAGAGEIDVRAALDAPAGTANGGLARSNGLGSLDASRGDVRVRSDDLFGTLVGGMLTAQLLLWDPIAFTTGEWTGSAWYGSAWYGSAWYGSAWYGQPDGSAWYGSAWYGSAWYGAWE